MTPPYRVLVSAPPGLRPLLLVWDPVTERYMVMFADQVRSTST